MKYEVVIFDFDGTLANTREDVWLSVEYAAECIGSEVADTFRENAQNLSLPLEVIFQSLIPKPDESLMGLFDSELTKHYRQLNSFPESFLYPGIETLLIGLQERGIKRYIVSMKPWQALDKILKSKGWDVYFEDWFSVEAKDGTKKTKVEILNQLQSSMQGKANVYVGDSYTDIIAAKQCGMDSVGVLYGDGDAARVMQEEPTYHVKTGSELSRILLEGSYVK